jgi:hypothetical protein
MRVTRRQALAAVDPVALGHECGSHLALAATHRHFLDAISGAWRAAPWKWTQENSNIPRKAHCGALMVC